MDDNVRRTVESMKASYGMWGEHPQFSPSDWAYEVDSGDTRLGYWEWVAAKVCD